MHFDIMCYFYSNGGITFDIMTATKTVENLTLKVSKCNI